MVLIEKLRGARSEELGEGEQKIVILRVGGACEGDERSDELSLFDKEYAVTSLQFCLTSKTVLYGREPLS